MASIRCAHCKKTHTSVAAVRACAAASRHPVGTTYGGVTNVGGGEKFSSHVELPTTLAVGNVVTLRNAPGVYWEVDEIINTTAPGTNIHIVSISKTHADQRWIREGEVQQSWTDLTTAANFLLAQPTTAPEQSQTVARVGQADQPVHTGNWDQVNGLRIAVRQHLVREERGKLVGYFALLDATDGDTKVKFYRVRSPLRGKWAGKVFIDAQASDDFWPVRQFTATVQILEGILADPYEAGRLYARELGRCCRCRRTLTDETSRAFGIGPECRKKIR